MEPVVVCVRHRADAEAARRRARSLALELGFGRIATEAIVLSVSELAMNLAKYAPGGEIVLSVVEGGRGAGMQIESRDHGPGIADVAQAMEDRFSTSGSLGSGLPAVKRLTHEFQIISDATGTSIRAVVWLTPRSS